MSQQVEETSKRYDINEVGDILKIPEDKFDDFLVSLKQWYEVGRSLSKEIGCDPVAAKMAWVDDGKNDMRVNVHVVRVGGEG